jgi:hypothetical protein
MHLLTQDGYNGYNLRHCVRRSIGVTLNFEPGGALSTIPASSAPGQNGAAGENGAGTSPCRNTRPTPNQSALHTRWSRRSNLPHDHVIRRDCRSDDPDEALAGNLWLGPRDFFDSYAARCAEASAQNGKRQHHALWRNDRAAVRSVLDMHLPACRQTKRRRVHPEKKTENL